MFGMAGIPPTIGFFRQMVGFVGVGRRRICLVGGGGGGVFADRRVYYLRVVKLMFFDSPPPAARPLVFAPGALWPLALVGFLVLWWGVFPGDLLALCEQAARVSLAG